MITSEAALQLLMGGGATGIVGLILKAWFDRKKTNSDVQLVVSNMAADWLKKADDRLKALEEKNAELDRKNAVLDRDNAALKRDNVDLKTRVGTLERHERDYRALIEYAMIGHPDAAELRRRYETIEL